MAGLRLVGVAHRFLEPVELTLAAGELVFLSGPSGSGKSLLLRAIADLDPNQGEAWLGDEARSSMPPPRWRRRVGLLPAESHWWDETVGAHLPVAAGVADAETISDWLPRIGFEPDVLQWTISRLSTGERQRLALLRLLAQRPEALLLDEPTANLDPINRDRVEALLDAYRHAADAATLWVSHDPDQRNRLGRLRGGRTVMLLNGRLEPESWT